MTKAQFKNLVSFHKYQGNSERHNAFFFDWSEKNIEVGVGFKYGVVCRVGEDGCTKAELFNHFYDWLFNEVSLPYYVRYKCAVDDSGRFKAPISLNF